MTDRSRAVANRLTPELEAAWTPVPNALIEGMRKVEWWVDGEKKKLRPAHFTVLVFLLASKWDARHPYPSMRYISERSGMSYRTVLDTMEDLCVAGLVKKRALQTRATRRTRYEYDVSGLLDRLNEIHREIIQPKLQEAENNRLLHSVEEG